MKTPQPECQKFAARLIEAMLESGQKSQRKSQTGVTTQMLREIAGVTNEMARRYTLGLAWPDTEKMVRIARWLGVRQAWLQYGEEPKRLEHNIKESRSSYSSGPASPLTAGQIELLQHCLLYTMQLNRSGLELSEQAQAKAAATFFNHCLTHHITPQVMPDDIRDAVLTALSSP